MPVFQLRKMIEDEDAHCYKDSRECEGDLYYCYDCNTRFCKEHATEHRISFHIKHPPLHIYDIDRILPKIYDTRLEKLKAGSFGMRINTRRKSNRKSNRKRS
jgi:hypothetical protein